MASIISGMFSIITSTIKTFFKIGISTICISGIIGVIGILTKPSDDSLDEALSRYIKNKFSKSNRLVTYVAPSLINKSSIKNINDYVIFKGARVTLADNTKLDFIGVFNGWYNI